jgi:hypothetical protein
VLRSIWVFSQFAYRDKRVVGVFIFVWYFTS